MAEGRDESPSRPRVFLAEAVASARRPYVSHPAVTDALEKNPYFSVDNPRLYANLMHVTIWHIGSGGGGTKIPASGESASICGQFQIWLRLAALGLLRLFAANQSKRLSMNCLHATYVKYNST